MILAVDTSAIVAMLQDEPEALASAERLARNEPVMSAGTLIETLRVLRLRRGQAATDRARRLAGANGIEIVPVDRLQAQHADEGMRRFGKGCGSPPAVLHFGDLFAHAPARQLDAPPLFEGDGFRQTDVKIAAL